MLLTLRWWHANILAKKRVALCALFHYIRNWFAELFECKHCKFHGWKRAHHHDFLIQFFSFFSNRKQIYRNFALIRHSHRFLTFRHSIHINKDIEHAIERQIMHER